ncbi:MAG: hypothetical protein ACKV2Q_15460 [Planctomycetaceae bacterium]
MLLFNWLNSVRHRAGRRARQRRALVGQRSMTTSRQLGITTVDVAPKIEGLEDRSLLTTIDLAALTAAQGTSGLSLTRARRDADCRSHRGRSGTVPLDIEPV